MNTHGLTSIQGIIMDMDGERKKPHPDLFLAAARKLKISPTHCLVIEDAPSGIEAAARAGMSSLGLTTGFSSDALEQAGAGIVAPDLAHVPLSCFQSVG